MKSPDEAEDKKKSEAKTDPTDSILIDLSITQAPLMNIGTLEGAYKKAVAAGEDRFVFEGRKFHTKATKYLLERITGRKMPEPSGGPSTDES